MHVYTVTAVQSPELDVVSRGKRRDFLLIGHIGLTYYFLLLFLFSPSIISG